MLKPIFHIVLILLILLSGMNYSLIQSHFYLNRAKIAAELCENKDKVELACDGLCVLEKRLSEAQNHEQDQQRSYIEDLPINYLITQIIGVKENFPVMPLLKLKITWILNSVYLQFLFDVFHPPKIS